MRTPFKVMWVFIIGIVGFVAFSSFTQQQGEASTTSDGTAIASEANTSGWASSTGIFMERWNSEVEAAYRISDFHKTRLGYNAGDFLGGTILQYDQTFTLTTHNQDMFASLCVQTTEASLGIPLDDAVAVVRQAVSDMQTAPMSYGLVDFHGYYVSTQVFAAAQNYVCTIRPKSD
ncbi:hypothetical protein [Rhodanobacter sp. OK091]|uniref:hypothetical protein n=1 Tax=Rhodanobacter sp. OK091 TaxID=1881037 RepID=UPI000913BFBD|nr:hypothetical protein [Rhodanobacter sp. OK091]SHL89686.1 hypothetical protein SAMN05428972_1812 [Rhodanobacter sp. OK091]